jgi:REP element-mobilizing transposase RayT
MEYYRRNLPHWQINGAEYFITIRLINSLPKEVILDIQERRREFQRKTLKEGRSNHDLKQRLERKLFKKFEQYLDNPSSGSVWLKNDKVANIAKESLHYRDGKDYSLYAYCIMSNHIHIVFRHISKKDNQLDKEHLAPITKILKSYKSYTALRANKLLKRQGAFWQEESFDRIIRNQKELENVIAYTLNNPVKANLVSSWQEWPHSYCKKEFIESF